MLVAGASARAQVSPGPLSKAHESLDENRFCNECHASGREKMSNDCLACHREVAWLLERNRGLHAQNSGKRCAGCHPDHAGRDFDLIEWGEGGIERFDHGKTGWLLTGEHHDLRCRDCHKSALQTSPVFALLRRHDAASSWLGLDSVCVSCHEDRHAGRFGPNCADCHKTSDWKTVDKTRFDHAKTRYPLTGRHATAECVKCHDPVHAWGKKPAFDRCDACHRDPHNGQATIAGRAVDCESCHDTGGFRPARYTAEMHASSPYPLQGSHRTVPCEGCHGRSPSLRLRPAHEFCLDCHADAHAGQLTTHASKGECSACHDVKGWKPARFGVAEHRQASFPLVGRHASAPCAACHAPDRKDLPPPPVPNRPGAARIALALAEKRCIDCHQDPHQGRYEGAGSPVVVEGCATCHDAERFKPSSIDPIGHARLGSPLVGAHRAVPCVSCHTELRADGAGAALILAQEKCAPLPFTARRLACSDCHLGPHGSQFATRPQGGACDGCHDMESFRPARAFDHDRDSKFPLTGSHKNVPCGECHAPQMNERGETSIRYRAVSTECRSCHAEKAPGEPQHGPGGK